MSKFALVQFLPQPGSFTVALTWRPMTSSLTLSGGRENLTRTARAGPGVWGLGVHQAAVSDPGLLLWTHWVITCNHLRESRWEPGRQDGDSSGVEGETDSSGGRGGWGRGGQDQKWEVTTSCCRGVLCGSHVVGSTVPIAELR